MEYGNLKVYFQPQTHKMEQDENIAESIERQKGDVERLEKVERLGRLERLEEKLISNNIF